MGKLYHILTPFFRFLGVSLVWAPLSVLAYVPKEGNVNAILGPFVSKTDYAPPGSFEPPPILGGVGLIAQGDVSDHGSLEIGLFHMNKVFIRNEGPNYIAEQIRAMHVTMGYRRWLSESFSASWAFFSSYAMGDSQVIEQKGSPLNTSASDITEYGLDLSIQGEVWSQDRLSVILDARYSLDVTKKENEAADNFGFLVGVKYFIQEKQFVKKSKDAI